MCYDATVPEMNRFCFSIRAGSPFVALSVWTGISRSQQLLLYVYVFSGLPYYVRVLAVSTTGGVIFFVTLMYARRWLLRILLSYRGWMCTYCLKSRVMCCDW